MTLSMFHIHVRHSPFTIQCPHNSGLAYSDLHDPPWTTSSPGKGALFKLYQYQESIRVAVYQLVPRFVGLSGMLDITHTPIYHVECLAIYPCYVVLHLTVYITLRISWCFLFPKIGNILGASMDTKRMFQSNPYHHMLTKHVVWM